MTEQHKSYIIWSSSQPFCPSYPSSTSVPLGEWDRLPCEGPHQFVGFHPPTTLTWGSSLSHSPLNNTWLPQKLIFVQQPEHIRSKKQALIFQLQTLIVVEQHRWQKAQLKPLDRIKMYEMYLIVICSFLISELLRPIGVRLNWDNLQCNSYHYYWLNW